MGWVSRFSPCREQCERCLGEDRSYLHARAKRDAWVALAQPARMYLGSVPEVPWRVCWESELTDIDHAVVSALLARCYPPVVRDIHRRPVVVGRPARGTRPGWERA